MRKILFWLFLFAFTASLARAQDAATQQQIDQINGRIQDLIDAQAAQGKRLATLEKSVSDLQDKLNQPVANSGASADDLKKLAAQVQEIDRKRQEDNQKILDALEKLGKAGGATTVSHKPAVSTTTSTDTSTTPLTGPQKGYYYTIQEKDTLSAIAKAYSAELKIKLTAEQIQAANPGLNPKNLIVGKKIFIPDPSAK